MNILTTRRTAPQTTLLHALNSSHRMCRAPMEPRAQLEKGQRKIGMAPVPVNKAQRGNR